MSDERFLVTGAAGCIGAWVCRRLLDEGVDVVALDHRASDHRLRLVVGDDGLSRLRRVDCDVTDLAALTEVVIEGEITHVIHLAALQIPFCRADPSRGAQVNVVGTVNVFEAAKLAGGLAGPLVYASSAAAYDPSDVADDVPPRGPSGRTTTLYGVYKLANEGTARIYWQDETLPSVGLRPSVVYGVGRDQGLSAAPTRAMLAAAAGRPWTIRYGGRSRLQLADDVAAAFVAAARAPFQRDEVYDLGGAVVEMEEVVAAIESAVPSAAGTLEVDGPPLPFPPVPADPRLERAVGPPPTTPLAEGVARTIEHFRRLLAEGRIAADDLEAG